MLKYLKNNRAQAAVGEYVLVLALVVAVVTVMTVYFKRVVQSRIKSARDSMFNIVRSRGSTYFSGSVNLEYEPYYMNTDSISTRREDAQMGLRRGGVTGLFDKTSDTVTTVTTEGVTAPPKDAR